MRLVKNEPKVVEVALTRGNLLGLIAQFDSGKDEAYLATLDEPTGYLVKVTVVPGSPLDRRSPTLPRELQDAIDRAESCLEDATLENGR